ncbi:MULTISPECIES: hypothetical protein [Pseudomonas]|uniref:hypothetical protein n=1 Tax=Pseudomonas TaxID=286 RepID=UPI00160CE60A|nr:hypothetical protein [Pseudomonas sp. JAI115]MBB6154959.1 hypothetical protein [Pseudomonas sp. JAI115]
MEVSDKCIHRAMGYAALLSGKKPIRDPKALAVTVILVIERFGYSRFLQRVELFKHGIYAFD